MGLYTIQLQDEFYNRLREFCKQGGYMSLGSLLQVCAEEYINKMSEKNGS